MNNQDKLFKEMCHYKSKCVDLMCELDNKKAKFNLKELQIDNLKLENKDLIERLKVAKTKFDKFLCALKEEKLKNDWGEYCYVISEERLEDELSSKQEGKE